MSYLIGLLPGLGLTFFLWALIVVIGFPVGLVFGYGLTMRSAIVRIPVLIVVNVARGVPGLVTLYFVYSGLPSIGVLLNSTTAMIIAFAFTTAGYTAGIFRAALDSVPPAQFEAASALGIGYWRSQRLVVLPQALRTVLPPLVGFSVIVLQATSLGYAVGLRELTGLAYSLGSIAFEALQYMLASGVFYLVICILISRAAVLLQRRRSRVRATNARPSPTGTSAVRTVG